METTSKSWPAGPKPRVGRKCSEHVFKPWTKVLGYCTLKENSRDEGLALEVPLQGFNVTSRELINKACKERKNPSTRWLVFLHIGRLLQSRGSTNMNFPWHRFIFYMGSFWPLTRFTISTKLTHEFVDFIFTSTTWFYFHTKFGRKCLLGGPCLHEECERVHLML